MPNPFRRDPHPDLTRAIRAVTEAIGSEGDTHGGGASSPKRNGAASKKPKSVLPPQVRYTPTTPRVSEPLRISESHTKAQLERLSVGRLRELLKQYEGRAARAGIPKGDLARELADIRAVLRSKGAGSVLDEASPCERAALARLKAANAEDLKEKGGKAGEAAHKRLHKTLKSVLGESATKAALEDWMYSIPPAAVEALRPVMKIKSLTKRFAAITKTLKAHGFTTRFMGSMPANVVNDYYDTFFGE